MGRPVLFASLATAAMLVIAIPALSLNWGTGALAQLPKDNETRIGFEQAAQAAGPGALGPVLVVADGGDRAPDAAAVEKYRQAVQAAARGRRGLQAHARIRRARRADQRDAQGRPRERRGRRAGPAAARAERPGDHAARGRRERRRRRRAEPRLQPPHLRVAVEDPALRAGLQLRRAARRAALGAAALEGRDHERALGGRRLRRPRDRLPVRLDRQPHRLRPSRLRQCADPTADLGDRVRLVDGLRGLPALAHPRALLTRPATTASRCPRAWPPARRRSRVPRSSWSPCSRSSRSPACRRSRRSASAWPSRSSSTRRSCASCSSRPRWSSWASGTGGCPSWLDRILPDMDFESSPEPVVEHAEPPLVTT